MEEQADPLAIINELRELLAIEKQKCKLLRNAVKEDREIKQQLQLDLQQSQKLL